MKRLLTIAFAFLVTCSITVFAQTTSGAAQTDDNAAKTDKKVQKAEKKEAKAAEKGKLTRGQHRNVCQSIFEHVSWR